MAIALFEIKKNKKLILGWAISLLSIQFLYMLLFPYVKEMGLEKMEAMPEAMTKLFQMEDTNSFLNYNSYFVVITNILILAASIFAATFAARVIVVDESNKSIEFLYSLDLSRSDIFWGKALGSFMAVAIVGLAILGPGIISGFISGGSSFEFFELLKSGICLILTPFFFWGIGIFMGGIWGGSNSSSISGMMVLVFYLSGYLGSLLGSSGEFLEYLSPFIKFSERDIIPMAIFVGVTNVLVFIASKIYSRRDFKI